MWVDGSDPAWCEKKNRYLLEANPLEKSLASPERWQDNDELLYSLRGAEQFLPWFNHIFIVTDGQRPAWLKLPNPRVTLVSHSDFIPQEYLPLFCSSAIEFFLPLIPGLSEHFLFANDDMFFGRPIPPSRFFDADGNPKVQVKRLSPKSFVHDDSLASELLQDKKMASRIRSNLLISKMFNCDMNWESAHVIDPCRKSYMLEMLAEPAFAEAIEKTRRSRFRSPETIQRIMFPLYDSCRKRTTIKDIRSFRELKRIFAPHRLPLMVSLEKDLAKILKIRPEMFCFYDNGNYYEALRKFFREYYPNKSSFEN